MSKFSGKCDLYDWFGMIACEEGETPYECYKRIGSKIYVDNITGLEEAKIEKPSDLVMFYPFVEYLHCHSDEDIDAHYLPKRSYLADVVTHNPPGAAYYLDTLMKEYWRVKEEEDPKYYGH